MRRCIRSAVLQRRASKVAFVRQGGRHALSGTPSQALVLGECDHLQRPPDQAKVVSKPILHTFSIFRGMAGSYSIRIDESLPLQQTRTQTQGSDE